jgi:hypothetical protein
MIRDLLHCSDKTIPDFKYNMYFWAHFICWKCQYTGIIVQFGNFSRFENMTSFPKYLRKKRS